MHAEILNAVFQIVKIAAGLALSCYLTIASLKVAGDLLSQINERRAGR